MTETLSLFDIPQPHARHTDPVTSRQAAQRVERISENLTKQILDAFGRYRCMTKDQCCERLGIDARRWPTVASALSRLKEAGMLDWTGEIVEGQHVWRLRQTDVSTGDVL